MIGVERDAQHRISVRRRVDLIRQIERLLDGVEAGAVVGVHRMQRLQRQTNLRSARVFAKPGRALRDLRAGKRQIARARRKRADDHHETGRAQRRRLIYGAAIVRERRLKSRSVARGKISGAAIAGHLQSRVANLARDCGDVPPFEIAPPGTDAAETVAGDLLDHLLNGRAMAERGGVERAQIEPAVEIAHERQPPNP